LLTDTQILILFVYFTLGAILRTVWGYLWKYLETGELKWDHRYTATMIVSIIITLIFTITTFASLDLPTEWEFMHGFGFIAIGFTMNTLFNSTVAHMIRNKAVEQ